jgi:hypothetical protein
MQGVVKQLCDYLNITQILTGGHNPRGNAICERVNQTMGALIRKLNDQEYKDLKHYIPAFQFAMNITPHSAIGRSLLKLVMVYRLQHFRRHVYWHQGALTITSRGKIEEEDNPKALQGKVKDLVELAMRMSDVARSSSEWHRRMTAQNLGQNGRKIEIEKYTPGTKVYFYKPPSAMEAERKGRKAKHMDHYAGPATIIKKTGTRSFLIEFRNSEGKVRTFQRDVGMLSLIPARQVQFDPNLLERHQYEPMFIDLSLQPP